MVQQYIMLLTEVFYANKEQFVERFLQDDQLFFKKIIITNLKKMGRFWDIFTELIGWIPGIFNPNKFYLILKIRI